MLRFITRKIILFVKNYKLISLEIKIRKYLLKNLIYFSQITSISITCVICQELLSDKNFY